MTQYAASVFGWLAIIDTPTKREAVSRARQLAPSASLLPSDVNASNVRRATKEDIEWWEMMQSGAPPREPRFADLRCELPVPTNTLREMVAYKFATKLGDGSYTLTKEGSSWLNEWIKKQLAARSDNVSPT
jgi:hypothetical protein